MRRATPYLCLAVLLGACFAEMHLAKAEETKQVVEEFLARQRIQRYRPMNTLLGELESGSYQKSGLAYRELQDVRGDTMTLLLAIARNEANDEHRRRLAILLLAEYGPREAIPFLTQNIALRLGAAVANASNRDIVDYPCVMALVRIGQSSVPAILGSLTVPPSPSPVSEKAIEMYARTLLRIYHRGVGGHKEAIGVVERAKERARESHRENLQRLLDKLRKLTKDRK